MTDATKTPPPLLATATVLPDEQYKDFAAAVDASAKENEALTALLQSQSILVSGKPLDRAEHAEAEIERLRAALGQIAKPKYGLQGIIEDYSDANAFNYHAMTYWRDLAQSYEATARAALAKGDNA